MVLTVLKGCMQKTCSLFSFVLFSTCDFLSHFVKKQQKNCISKDIIDKSSCIMTNFDV